MKHECPICDGTGYLMGFTCDTCEGACEVGQETWLQWEAFNESIEQQRMETEMQFVDREPF